MKVLILKRDKIGDLLLTTPLLRHLRSTAPTVSIHVLANDYNAWVLSQNRDIDKLWIYPRARHGARLRIGAVVSQLRQLWSLRRERFDAVVVAGGEESPRAIKRAAWLGAKRTLGYCETPRLKRHLSDAFPVPHDMHEVDRMLALLNPLGIDSPANAPLPVLEPPAACHTAASAWLNEHGVAPGRYVVIGLGARRAKKQPSAEQVLAWSAHIKDRYELDSVFMWTPGSSDNRVYPGDDAVAAPVIARRPPYLHPCREPLLPAVGLVWAAQTSIFPDSGLMHIAAASPGGVIGLFATDSQSPSQWGPRGRRAEFLGGHERVANLDDTDMFRKLAMLLTNSPSSLRKAEG